MKFGESYQLVNGGLRAFSRYMNILGIFVLLVMMLIVVADVSLRYFFNDRLAGAYEITEFSLVIMVFFCLAYAMVKGDHVNVDLLVIRLSKHVQVILGAIFTFASIVIFGLITWRSIVFAQVQGTRGITSSILFLPTPVFIGLAAFGCLVLCLVMIFQFVDSISSLREKATWKTWLAVILGIIVTSLVIIAPLWLKEMDLNVNPITVGLLGLFFLIAALFTGMPIGFVMALVGFMGMTYIQGLNSSLALLGRVPYSQVANQAMTVIPLFILMGQFVFYAGISGQLYSTANKWLGSLPGGLAIATVGACAAFSAACGSSVATAATMGVISLPQMKQYKYDPSLATGCVAAGGTLGILIPPSVAFCVIGIMTEQAIGKLFMAGLLPGILLAFLFMVAIYIMTRINTSLGPPGPSISIVNKIIALKDVWGILVLFILVMGGIYLGVFTPTEAAGIGAFGALILGIINGKMKWDGFVEALVTTGRTTAMVFAIWIGAMIFGYFMTVTNITMELIAFVNSMQVNPYIVLAFVIVMYLVLGCVMESLALTILTVPLLFPIMTNLGFHPIWFAVIVVITAEMALITPPVGMNVYVICGIAKDVPMFTIFRGIMPFLICMLVCIVILTIFPQIALFLPSLMNK